MRYPGQRPLGFGGAVLVGYEIPLRREPGRSVDPSLEPGYAYGRYLARPRVDLQEIPDLGDAVELAVGGADREVEHVYRRRELDATRREGIEVDHPHNPRLVGVEVVGRTVWAHVACE